MTHDSDLDPSAVDDLVAAVAGIVIAPGDGGYDEARRPWNGRYDRHPGLIVQCATVDDVRRSLDFAATHGLPLAVRGGGHSYAGNTARDGALLIDLGPMDGVAVDPDARTARVGAGATWADVDAATVEHGLATTGATVSTVGVAGYTLGGGTGHLARTFGIAADNLRSAEVVTADGELVTASEDGHPDLFWALRGGSGNFGVVTAFEFDLHPIPEELLAGQIVHRLADAPEVLRHYRDVMADAPDELNCYAFVIPLPPLEVFPEDLHGEPALDLVAAYSGDLEAAEAAMAPLRSIGEPVFDGVAPTPYPELQQAFDAGVPSGERWHTRAQFLDALTDDAIDAFLDAVVPFKGPMTMVYFEPFGGAIGRVDPAATAFPHRDAAYSVHALVGWSDPARDDELVEWTEAFHAAMSPFSDGSVYVNLLGRDESERVPEAYGANYDRLRAVKAEWDPDNRFDSNHNVEPGG